MVKLNKPVAIILDIEGTTTSTKYAAGKLLPYIKNTLRSYLVEFWAQDVLATIIKELRDQAKKDMSKGIDVPQILDYGPGITDTKVLNSVVANVLWQMDEHRPSPALKNIQLLVWIYGYERKELKGHVFDDVPGSLEAWNKIEIEVYVFSSMSLQGQQLIFSYTNLGNLSQFIREHLDANEIGSKTEASSYKAIGKKISVRTDKILFITDNVKEARAAINAGCKALLIRRSGNKPISANSGPDKIQVIDSFDEIIFT